MPELLVSTGPFRQADDSRQVQAVVVENPSQPVERRVFIIDNNGTDIATTSTAVGTDELRTLTFSAASDFRNFAIRFIADDTGTASDVMMVAWYVNAASDVAAAAALSIDETVSTDNAASYLRRNQVVSGKTGAAITRMDLTGILGSGGSTTLVKDTVIVEVW